MDLKATGFVDLKTTGVIHPKIIKGMHWQSVEELEIEKKIAQGKRGGEDAGDCKESGEPSESPLMRRVPKLPREAERSSVREDSVEVLGVDVKNKKKVRGKVTVDSGAGESVWPSGVLGGADAVSTNAVGFVAANGNRMKNIGTKRVVFIKDQKRRAMGFHVTEVRKPLAAVSRIAEKGNIVQFGPNPEHCFIQNIQTKEKMMMQLEKGTCVFDVDFEVDEDTIVNEDLGFVGQA